MRPEAAGSRHFVTMYRTFWFGCVVLVAIWLQTTSAQPASQGARVFADQCENCIVSEGSGFSSFEDDCNCFVICNFVGSYKLSAMASPWIGYKRCCGCGASFSIIHLTCVNHLSKKSDCFDATSEATNPCASTPAGTKINRQDPDVFDGVLCAGFIECVASKTYSGNTLVDIVVPKQDCCPPDECFYQGTCSGANCVNGANTVCTNKMDPFDCNCTQPTLDEKECPFMEVTGNVNKFMGVESMFVYDCPAGTCWDDDLCNCVQTNNTGYPDCTEFLMSDFDGTGSGKQDVVMTDGLGNVVYSENDGGSLSGSGMYVTNGNDVLNVVGTAGMGFRADFVFRIKFMLEESDSDGNDENHCLVGNCFEAETHEPPTTTNTFRVRVERDADETAEEIEVFFRYLDRYSMVGNNFAEQVNLELTPPSPLALDTMYTLWGVFCSDTEEAGAILYQGDEEGGASELVEMEADIANAQKILSRQSGILIGNCRDNEGFEGSYDLVEFYFCKPEDDMEYQEVFEEIFD